MTQLEKLTSVLASVIAAVKSTAKLEKQIGNVKALLNQGGKFRMLREGRKAKGTGTISITFDFGSARYGAAAEELFTARLTELEDEYIVAKDTSDKFLGDPKILALMEAMDVNVDQLLADAVADADADDDEA